MVVFWVVMLYGLVGGYQCIRGISPEDGGSMLLQNIGIHLQVHMASLSEDHHQHLLHWENLKFHIFCVYCQPK
jgi:hypothetical protein